MSASLGPDERRQQPPRVLIGHVFVVVAACPAFRVRPPTPPPVLIAAIFSDVEFRLPDMIVARLTRESVGRALDLGVTAACIREFLERHVHRRAKESGFGVPDNVKDQIYLWEMVRLAAPRARPGRAAGSNLNMTRIPLTLVPAISLPRGSPPAF